MTENVEFDADKMNYGAMKSSARGPAGSAHQPSTGSTNKGGMVGWLTAHGWVKSDMAAQGILIAIVLVNIVLIWLIIKIF